MGQRIIRVTGELMRYFLRLPDDCNVVGLSPDPYFASGDWAVKVESPEFSDVPEGGAIPGVSPVYSMVDGQPRFNGWGRPSLPVVAPAPPEERAAVFAAIQADLAGTPSAAPVKFREFL